jgi:V/A-type H+-transporting ATPase subunit I
VAVARMLKVTVLGHTSVVDEVVGALQDTGVLEVEPQAYELPALEVGSSDPRLRRLQEYAADAQFVCEFLGRYHEPEVAFSAFITEKTHLSTDDYRALEPDMRFRRLYRECVNIADKLAGNERDIAGLEERIADLTPWRDFRMQIKDWRGTEHVHLFTGSVPARQGPDIRQMLRSRVSDVSIEELGPIGNRQAWVVMAHVGCVDEVRAALSTTDFREVSFPDLEDYPAEEIARAEDRIEEDRAVSKTLIERAKQLAEEDYHHAVALTQAIESELDALTVREDFGTTERAFLVEGWAMASQHDDLLQALEPWHEDVDVTFSEPAEDDHPPVQLRNPAILRPFEVLTDLYGRPNYGEVDPTPLLAPFFILFFGICISDVGYGLMLAIGAYLIKNRLDVAPGVKKFMDLLMLGGASSMVVGVLLGSYFAIPYESLPPFLQVLRVLDPLGDLTTFLIICLALGVTQVFFGVCVAAYERFRRGDAASAIFEQLSTIFLFAMIAVAVVVPGATRWAIVVGLGLTMLMQGRAISVAFGVQGVSAWDRGLGVGWLAVAVGAVLVLGLTGDIGIIWAFLVVSVLGMFVSKTVRRSVVALLGGAYAVYGMSSFIGDILSYTRLAALGLSGALVGWVFNILTGLVWGASTNLFTQGGASVALGALIVLAAVLVFVVGHTFNVVINLLGAFVHPARLQFVEFFSKFYEGGGRLFLPFRYRTKNLVFDAGKSRREGGAGS